METRNDLPSSRRTFLKTSAALVGTFPLAGSVLAKGFDEEIHDKGEAEPVKVTWLTKSMITYAAATCGVLWPRGKVNSKMFFEARDSKGGNVALQSWPLAFWPDGSLKWTGHAVTSQGEDLFITPVKKESVVKGISIAESADHIVVDTGKIKCTIAKKGTVPITSILRGSTVIAKDGRLVMLLQDQPDTEESKALTRKTLTGVTTTCMVEQNGPLRSVIKIMGNHKSEEGLTLIPFTVRLYFTFDSDAVRVMHTLIYDGDADKHFIKGIGISFDVPMRDKLYNRHVRFGNSEYEGVFAEAVQGLTGLRRDPGEAVRNAQRQGKAVPPENEFGPGVVNRLQYIPVFGDYTLTQMNDQSFSIRKRTQSGFSWLTSASGRRASGLGYIGTPNGGVALGVRNFWQSYPSQLDIRRAATETASITAWLWAPDSPAMDMRFYHDGMGQDTFPEQREGLEITYEDYEPGFGTAEGVARTSELLIWCLDKTPDNKSFLEMTSALQNPPLLMCDLKYLAAQKPFGGNWSLADRTSPARAKIEDQLDRYFDYYKSQIDTHHWYGFWNYGDFMHSYDADRHVWKYDVGGFAWDNSELSTDLWLWYYFLHTGKVDVFRVAEAMTRHTGEVDVHHTGKFAPLGSRHNVLHWGCSAKQLRISTAANRRIYYYLTGDERVGDLLDEQVEAAARLKELVPGRKLPGGGVPSGAASPDLLSVSFGTDWGAIAAAWLTRWERTNDPSIKQRLLNSMQSIGEQPQGFFTGSSWLDLKTGKFTISTDKSAGASHLSAVFGLTEICEELVSLTDVPKFTEAWIEYCRLYNGSPEEQQKELGQSLNKLNLQQGHSRLTAFAAYHQKDVTLAKRAWTEFYAGKAGLTIDNSKIKTITGPDVLAPVQEDRSVSTNAVAQWGLAAIQCLAFVGDQLPNE